MQSYDKQCIVIHSSSQGQIEFAQIDLRSKSTLRVLQFKEITKIFPIGEFLGGSAPYAFVIEQFVGPRLINIDNEQIVQRLRVDQEDVQLNMHLCNGIFIDGMKVLFLDKTKLKLASLLYSDTL